MPAVPETNAEAICYVNNQTQVCNKAAGIVCGYTDGSDSACARAAGDPVPDACDCSD